MASTKSVETGKQDLLNSYMKPFNWNSDKNHQLIKERGISFEEIVFCLQSNGLLDDISQRIFVVAIDDYVYLVPYVETENEIFLKTVIPSRKATKQYFGDHL